MNEQIEHAIKQIKKSLCKIKISGDKFGTGFFCRINIPNINSFQNLLIASNHVLGQNDILPGKTINLTLSDGQNLDLQIDPSYKTYTDVNYDITIIQIKSKNIIALNIDEQVFNSNKNNINAIYKNKSVYLFDFSDDSKKIYSVGLIQKIDENYKIESLCFNKRPSLGGPMVDSSTNTLIGIHSGSKGGLNWKNGTFIKGPIEEFIKKNNLNNIPQANQNMISYQNQNQNQFMNNNQQNQLMNNNNNNYNQNNHMNNINNMNQNQYMAPYPNINYMPNNIGYNNNYNFNYNNYNNSNYMNMSPNNNYVGMNQNNQFQNNNNIYPNQNNNSNYQYNNENDMNYQNQINQINQINQFNQNISSVQKEQKDIYEDMYPDIGGDKINITFKLFEHTEKKVKIPTIFHNSELYYIADKIKNPHLYKFTDLKKIKLYLNDSEIKNDNSIIGLKNEDIIVIKDNQAYYNKNINNKNQSKTKLNIHFKQGPVEISKLFFPVDFTFDKMCMEFFFKNNIQESNKNNFLFKYEGKFIKSDSKDTLFKYKLRNNSTIEIIIKDANKKYPGREIKGKIIDEKNNLIFNIMAGTLQKIKDFYEELKVEKPANLPFFDKFVINPGMNEVEFKIDNKKLNDERSFLSIGINNDFTCKVFKSRNLMSNKKK